jgi:hypothetical protein
MNTVPPAADQRLHHARERRILQRREIGPQQHPIRQHRDQYEQRQHAQEAEHGGNAYVLAVARVARVDARAFDADEDEHGDQHRVADLVEHVAECRRRTAPEVEREDIRAKTGDRDHEEHDEGDDLGDRDDGVERGRLFHAA